MTDDERGARGTDQRAERAGRVDGDRSWSLGFACIAAVADVVGVCVFVVVGRRSHAEGEAAIDTLEIATPFLLALVVGWIGTRAWRHVTAPAVGATIAAATVALGLLLRRFVFDRGTAVGFVVVTTIVLGGYLVGWRYLARALSRRRRSST